MDNGGSDKTPPCPLCGGGEARAFAEGEGRAYLHCPGCRLIFVPEKYWPSPDEEKARYDQHQNAPGDAGYVAFLEKIAAPLAERLPPGARGLDYGCGPAPVLCGLLAERGFETRPYDPFYFPGSPGPAGPPGPPEGPYDFIVSTETFEHFRRPREEMERLRGLLRPGGLLGVMTWLWTDENFVENWHYRRDFTHLCFYRRETFEWIAGAMGLEIPWSDGERALILRRL
jgi:SAM-dependent methyltransferase